MQYRFLFGRVEQTKTDRKMPQCPSCKSTSIETDHARGSAVCTMCGMVLEDNIIMAEVSFMDTDKGAENALAFCLTLFFQEEAV